MCFQIKYLIYVQRLFGVELPTTVDKTQPNPTEPNQIPPKYFLNQTNVIYMFSWPFKEYPPNNTKRIPNTYVAHTITTLSRCFTYNLFDTCVIKQNIAIELINSHLLKYGKSSLIRWKSYTKRNAENKKQKKKAPQQTNKQTKNKTKKKKPKQNKNKKPATNHIQKETQKTKTKTKEETNKKQKTLQILEAISIKK